MKFYANYRINPIFCVSCCTTSHLSHCVDRPLSVERCPNDEHFLAISDETRTSQKSRPISNFFTKLSKEDYRKEVQRSAAKSVLTVRALVHSPEPPPESPSAQTKPAAKKTCGQAAKRYF
jgi:hypothetical protein